MPNAAISIQQVAKHFGDFQALKTVSLEIQEGEFFTLLGPSGCGKTTLLKLLGGFEQTSAGRIFLFDQEIEQLPANRRPINTVFQQYALFPHMSIHENVQFGMKMQGIKKKAREQRATEMLELVQLGRFAQRKPTELSGGQQQRVALARALAPKPKVLLLDEPLSALDLKLRQSMRIELKRIQQETGITFVFVTHDQEEALTMSDRIAVMSAGELQQVGSPRTIYEEPANRFVANFIGETNLLQVQTDAVDTQRQVARVHFLAANKATACAPASPFYIDCPTIDALSPGQPAWLSIRPERLSLMAESPHSDGLAGTISQVIYMGTDTQYVVQLDIGHELSARIQNMASQTQPLQSGQRVQVSLDEQAVRLLVA
ncbi:ABC transporter ATP-binding protein [Candidatus Thalassolituus haligoni]|uniref:ABC transporter ATP-binding protein n=1 Tax=Candidatus Thalassolituus haligoni TaxID=3100113 RepID=UPI003514A43A